VSDSSRSRRRRPPTIEFGSTSSAGVDPATLDPVGVSDWRQWPDPNAAVQVAALARSSSGSVAISRLVVAVPRPDPGTVTRLSPGLWEVACSLVALLRLPEPYSFDLSTERFRAFGTDLANRWLDEALWHWLGGREVRIAAAPGGVDVEPFEPEARVLLGVQFDLDAFYAFAATEPVLARLVPPLTGFRPPLAPDPFEMLVGAITAQQVSLFSATATRNRLLERYGQPGAVAIRFPTQCELAATATEDELLALGFSRRKAEYILSLARTTIDWDGLATLPDDEVKSRLTAHRGIGEWTADWYLGRHLARPRAWPAGDLALRRALARFYPELAADPRAAGDRFAPFENLTAHYLLLAARTP
jgi:3-methyladenine DNA glycosylase/8-oxoguanine DNA glycosylase